MRVSRVWHRFWGTTLAVFLLISAVTGILLALKKEVALLQPPTQKGMATDLSQWKHLDELSQIAQEALILAHPSLAQNTIDRIDARPSKGIVKVLFKKGNWEVQLDATTGVVKSIAKRHSDWIESLHDGSIVSDLFKLISMNVLGLGLVLMIGTGLWLWYGPQRYRTLKRKKT